MTLLPKSRKARRRLAAVAVAAPILAGAAGLALYAMGDSVSLFYSPSQAQHAHVPAGRAIDLGGLVAKGSVVKKTDGTVEFAIADHAAVSRVVYRGDLPDLFREGQGVVTKGAYRSDGVFAATEVLAKHDEKYMPKEVTRALKASGEWRGDGGPQTQAAMQAAGGQ
ncbi:cytochrome c maturation protein CcmE [Phenylobacterium montanum]|uniref:Cytochrome c-type biogenesis protein CcmE n=1 Tax=Phenylobacterium montanum TaxID=2823693 RepID=A0A975FW79_9CAUL|nr:cytochrome c maturation protein CcmE [Caulobacter sp. S6]QUD86109.1 cytochrome c maturation protein CcmE [Caulobacter sp. S6]